jgi:hypothetical protein
VRMRKGIGVVCLLILFIGAFQGSARAQCEYVVLYGDTLGGPGGADHWKWNGIGKWKPVPYVIEMWVWFRPNCVKGMSGAEFMIHYPPLADMEQGAITSNPLNQAEVGTLEGGISVSLGSNCQYDWYWTHHQELIVKTYLPSSISVVGHPANGGPIYVASCENGSPKYVAPTILPFLYINNDYQDVPPPTPDLCAAVVESSTVVHARYNFCAFSFTFPIDEEFVLWDKSNPLNSIHTVNVEDVGYLGTDFRLTLEGPMTDSTTYVLLARSMKLCECYYDQYYGCSSHPSTTEFTYYEWIATFLQSSSASLVGSSIEVAWELSEVDGGIEFFVSRSEDGGDFTLLNGRALERDGLKFTYVDRSVEPGRRYSYKVEYGIGAPSKLLFISEAISTPAMPMTLYQNKPNPFNPSTTIKYYLPGDDQVTLDIYDLTGRLVSRLINREFQSKGMHSAEWRGFDDRGQSVSSGVYFYRLHAGKETISRKMVLLK